MRHHHRRALPDKQNALNKFNSRVKARSSGLSAPGHTLVFSNGKADAHFDVPQKTKRLKTVKQRNQLREQGITRYNQCKRGSIDKQQGSEDQDSQCGHLLTFSRKVKPGAKLCPSQKPSIITEGRLTSIRGLFSHEVRSVDIERLVERTKHKKHTEKEEGRATGNSSSPSGVIPHSTSPVVISETSEEGISAHSNIIQQPKTFKKAEEVSMNLEDIVPVDGKHSSRQKATNNTDQSESPTDQTGIQEAVIFSSSESVHKSFPKSVEDICQIDHYISPNTNDTHDPTNKAPAKVLNSAEHLDTPVGSHSNAQLFEPSPETFKFVSPTLDRERCSLGNETPRVFSPKKEAVSRLAARLCRNLVSFPPQPCCHLLSECQQVLKHQLIENHGSRLQHNLRRLRSYLSTETPHSPHPWPSSVQPYLDISPQIYFDCTGKYEEDEPRETMNFLQENSSPKQFCKNVERGEDFKRHAWGMYSPDDYVTDLQQPGHDTLSQWSNRAEHTPKSHTTFSPHQTFAGPQTSTSWPDKGTDQLLNPFFPEPQKQVKLRSSDSRRRLNTTLPLLEQWRNDPDLNFLFQDENSKRSHTSVGTLSETCPPHHYIQSVHRERSLFSAASAVSPFFPPEGFCYEPYYRFPHPSNSFSRPDKTDATLYTDVDKSASLSILF